MHDVHYTAIAPKPTAPPKQFCFAIVWHTGYQTPEGKVTSAPGWYIPEPNEGDTLLDVVDNLPEGASRLHSVWKMDLHNGTLTDVSSDARDLVDSDVWYRETR